MLLYLCCTQGQARGYLLARPWLHNRNYLEYNKTFDIKLNYLTFSPPLHHYRHPSTHHHNISISNHWGRSHVHNKHKRLLPVVSFLQNTSCHWYQPKGLCYLLTSTESYRLNQLFCTSQPRDSLVVFRTVLTKVHPDIFLQWNELFVSTTV